MDPVLSSPSADAVLVVEIDDRHATPEWHPERAARLDAVRSGIDAVPNVRRLATRAATAPELERVHDRAYLDALAELCALGGGELDPDTLMSTGSFDTALLAAGAGLVAIDALRAGAGHAAFVSVRPPGHHANARRAMGFCLVNNVAVAAATLRDAGERVLILDWDAHHGNGTQEIFWDDPDVMYASLHQWPAYPGTGRVDEVGGPGAHGTTINIPLPPGATGDVALRALEHVVRPAMEQLGPAWVLVSCGFDAHASDPITDLGWSAGDFAFLTESVMRWAPGDGRLIAFLEGGYDLDALRDSTIATVSTLAGDPQLPEPPTSGGPGMDSVDRIVEFWASI